MSRGDQKRRRAAVGKRSDIWSFGVLSTRCSPAVAHFDSEDVSDTLANVLKGKPDWSALPPGPLASRQTPGTSEAVACVIGKVLTKLPF
jgi:hypothetical protein